MPKVGKKHFAYTEKGKKAAKQPKNMPKKLVRKSKKQKGTEMAKYKKVKMKKGERIGAVPTRGAPKQKQSAGGKAKKGKK